jgi:hypothetical protein
MKNVNIKSFVLEIFAPTISFGIVGKNNLKT